MPEEKKQTNFFQSKKLFIAGGLIVAIVLFILFMPREKGILDNFFGSNYSNPEKLPTVKGEFKTRFSEEQVKRAFKKELAVGEDGSEISSINIDFEDEQGSIEITWQKGESLSADLIVSADEKRLELSNLNIENEGAGSEALEGFANTLLDDVFSRWFSDYVKLVKLDLEDDLLDAYFRYDIVVEE